MSNATRGRSGQTAKVPAPIISRILSGSVGSIVYVLALTPLEVVKVRQQAAGSCSGPGSGKNHVVVASSGSVQSSLKAFHRGRGAVMLNNGLILPKSTFPCLEAPRYHIGVSRTSIGARVFESTSCHIVTPTRLARPGGVISILLSIARTEGRAGLYAGLRPSLLVAVPNTAIYFTTYDDIIGQLRRRHAENNAVNGAVVKQPLYMPLVAGATARFIASIATAPLELVRTIQASSFDQSRTIREELSLILKSHGLSGLYRGLGPMVLRDVPFSAVYFLGFESFKNALSTSNFLGPWGVNYYKEHNMEAPHSVELAQSLGSGAAAGTIATILTTPFDVVKTQRQAALDNSRPGNSKQGMMSYMKQIVKQEGLFAGLWKGNQIRMVKVVPGHAIMIACYEFGKRFLEDSV